MQNSNLSSCKYLIIIIICHAWHSINFLNHFFTSLHFISHETFLPQKQKTISNILGTDLHFIPIYMMMLIIVVAQCEQIEEFCRYRFAFTLSLPKVFP
jgi:hypothetical protein